MFGRKTTVKSTIYVKELVNFIDFLILNETQSDLYNFTFPETSDMKKIISCFKQIFAFKPFTPVIPYKMMLYVAYTFEFLNSVGLTNSIHHRRIQKLYFSTSIYPKNALKEGYKFKYDLKLSLEDWKKSNITGK